jgi:Luciferase-like monooxygenase
VSGFADFPLVLGLDTFGDLIHDDDGRPPSHAQTIRSVVEQGVLADEVGVDFFGIGEHHTGDFPMPAADVALAAIAARTTRIHVGSAVTVLSSDDPVRVFQRYSTLNAVSAAGPRSSSDAAPASNRSHSSATTSPTTSACSRRRPTSSQSS